MCVDTNKLREGWNSKSLASLIEHIVQTHHVFCRQEATRLLSLFKETIETHGTKHPELKEMKDLFFRMSRDLSMHLLKEEQTLFPYIVRVEEAVAQKSQLFWPPFGTVENPIRMMVLEHDQAGEELKTLRKLSQEYKLPADADDRYAALYEGLSAFDSDMQRHIDCEDNLLFPRAVAMEADACGKPRTVGG